MKKVFIIIGCIFLGLTIFECASSLAVFETNVDVENDLDIANFHIFVNDYDLGVNNTFYIDDITYTNNEGVSEGKFAPGVTGEFILEIDPKDTEVSVLYELNIQMDERYPQIKLDSVEGIDGTMLTKKDDIYSNIITLDDITNGKTNKIKVVFSWEDNEENNESDSTLGLDGTGVMEIPINIKFNQYMG